MLYIDDGIDIGRTMTNEYNKALCPICSSSAYISAFCIDHDSGWAHSEERKMVDFSSDASYAEQVARYATNFIAKQTEEKEV